MSVSWWRTVAELVLCALAGWRLWRLRPAVIGTTLVDAWGWACGVAGISAVVSAIGCSGRPFPAGDCLVAVIGLTPLVAVLGARRPTNRVWTPFVMLPLVVVLYWPVLWVVATRGWLASVALELPALAGFALVAVMACGNYIGTRLMFAALVWGLALGALLWSASSDDWLGSGRVRLAMGLVGIFGLWRVEMVWTISTATADRFDRVWFDILDRFGVVWARRLQERLNALARQHTWPGQLELDGWKWRQPLTAEQQQQLEHACRWLLRRFVDAPWLDARLGTKAVAIKTLSVDS